MSPEADSDSTLFIAEIPYETGELRFRFARKRSSDGTRWLREGLFQEFYRDGQLASEGGFVDDLEEGRWREYHPNGQLAAEGCYSAGKEHGVWRFWTETGEEEREGQFEFGVEK